MATETIFFSYSRTDSEFVLKLAKDLRQAGAQVWVDQLDIKPGSHWDSSIESALDSAKRMIVILSPASVKSNNVMDEVSLALESGKTVIPVLMSECKLPFRLKRLQWVDFTGDYQTSLHYLLKAIGHTIGSAAETESIIKDNEAIQTLESKKTPDPEQLKRYETDREKPEVLVKKSVSRNHLFIIAGVVVSVLAIWGVTKLFSGKPDNSGKSGVVLTSKPNDSIKNNPVSNNVTQLEIGQEYQGGIIFYIDSTGKHGLIAAKNDLGQFDWKEAKQKCAAIGYGWHLPTKDELARLCKNKDKIGGFSGSNYWSSSEYDYNSSWYQYFYDAAGQSIQYNGASYRVRAVNTF